MKILILTAVLTLLLIQGLFADALSDAVKTDLEKLLTIALTPISSEMAYHMGFYTGSGNLSPVNTSGDMHMKFGLGFGFNTTDVYNRYKKRRGCF